MEARLVAPAKEGHQQHEADVEMFFHRERPRVIADRTEVVLEEEQLSPDSDRGLLRLAHGVVADGEKDHHPERRVDFPGAAPEETFQAEASGAKVLVEEQP